MKVLEFHDLKAEDRLRLIFEGAFDPRAVLENELESFLENLEQYAGGDWAPDIVEGKRRRKYSRAATHKALEEERHERVTTIGLYRTKWPALDMTPRLYFATTPPTLDVTVTVHPLSFFEEAERCRQLVEMVRAWAVRYPVAYAMAHSMADRALADAPDFGRDERTARKNGFDKIYEVFWLNVFGLKLVETVGRERLLSTPAHRVEELPNGAILLVTWPTVTDFASDAAREAQARAFVHLRPDLDLDSARKTLHERSAALAPVEPRFPPDVAPLLVRTLDRFAFHQRQRKIAEYNVWRPPTPEEWLPADAALPSNVAQPERVLEQYSLFAEHLAAMLHKEVPSVFEATPESLTDIDFYLWSEDFPKTRLREALDEHVVPAVGAYLGQVLVHHLGGQWVPRKTLAETQVRVGRRAWLPFVRAQRYLHSHQSLLDFSLTQLYRKAELHLVKDGELKPGERQ